MIDSTIVVVLHLPALSAGPLSRRPDGSALTRGDITRKLGPPHCESLSSSLEPAKTAVDGTTLVGRLFFHSVFGSGVWQGGEERPVRQRKVPNSRKEEGERRRRRRKKKWSLLQLTTTALLYYKKGTRQHHRINSVSL